MSVEQMRAVDRLMVDSGVSALQMMENAGSDVARQLTVLHRWGVPVSTHALRAHPAAVGTLYLADIGVPGHIVAAAGADGPDPYGVGLLVRISGSAFRAPSGGRREP